MEKVWHNTDKCLLFWDSDYILFWLQSMTEELSFQVIYLVVLNLLLLLKSKILHPTPGIQKV